MVLASGKVVRSSVSEVPAKGRDTMGVVFARFADDDKIIAVAKNSERNLEAESASDTLDAVEAGRVTKAILPWIPLMRGADSSDIIERCGL